MRPKVVLPAGPVTPQGAYELLHGHIPSVWLDSYDGTVRIYLMGGRAITDRTRPESVQIRKDGLKGLIPPWKPIKQKGASQDGATFIDALYDETQVTMVLDAYARDAIHLRRVVNYLIGSIDAIQVSKLNWYTHDLGPWWAEIRWEKTAPDAMSGAQRKRQQVTLMLSADHAFWQSHPHVDVFEFAYEDMADSFNYDTEDDENLGVNWPEHRYDGEGAGFWYANGDQAVWKDDPTPFFTQGVSVAHGPYRDFETVTNNQVINIEIGSFQEVTFPDGAENHILGRMNRNPDGSWAGDAVRASIGWTGIELSRFNNFVETRMKLEPSISPFPGETFSLVCGFEDDERVFRVLRNGFPVLYHKETDNGSELGPDHRGVGFGGRAGAAVITQATPAAVRKVSSGDNSTVSQNGFVEVHNRGDQPRYMEHTLFGPGTFKIYDGPGATDYVEIGPLLPNQVFYINTDPREYTVRDLTSVPPTPQELNVFQQAIRALTSFAAGNNLPPFLRQIESAFGIVPPQGNPYSLVDGRFSENSAIPAKSPGEKTKPYYVKVAIDDGNSTSKIISSLTPMRRMPV